MKDTDPRPMPPAVLAAYRNPLNLKQLLASDVFTDKERLSVRSELLERLIARHGNVEVYNSYSSKTMSIRRRISLFRKEFWDGMEFILSVEEYGGREDVLPELAAIMQPYWSRWWDALDWESTSAIADDFETATAVLGSRQMVWLAAQYARMVVDQVHNYYRTMVMSAITAAEACAISPSEETMKNAEQAADAVYNIGRGGDPSRVSATNSGYYAARAASSAAVEFLGGDNLQITVGRFVVSSVDSARSTLYGPSTEVICYITKRLITPTLITSASRGLR